MNFLFVVVLVIALVMAFSFIPVAQFKPWMDWWKNNTNVNDSSTRNSCFPMRLLAFYPYPNFMYYAADLFTWESKRFRYGYQAECLLDLMRSKAVGFHKPFVKSMSKDGKTEIFDWVGVLTPHGMCSSIEPVPANNPEFCDKYREKMFVSCNVLLTMERTGSGYPRLADWQKVDDINNNDGLCGYPYEIMGRAGAQYARHNLGPYAIWRAFLWIWGARCLDMDDPTVTCKLDGKEQRDRFCYGKNEWEVKENFFHSWWEIPVDSAVVRSYVIQRNVAGNDEPIYPEAMPILLGVSGMSECGGWYGYVRSAGNFGGFDSDGFYRAVWADVQVFNNPKDPSMSGGQCAMGGLAGTAGTTAIAGAMIVGSLASGPFAPFLIGLGLLAGAGAGAGAQVFSQKCDPRKNFS